MTKDTFYQITNVSLVGKKIQNTKYLSVAYNFEIFKDPYRPFRTKVWNQNFD